MATNAHVSTSTQFSFRDLRVWQESKKLAIDIIKILSATRQYALIDQLTRSSISISSNIAEGFERKGQLEFIQFLYIAKGSCAECITQLEICSELGIIDKETVKLFIHTAEEIKHMIMGLIAQERKYSKRL